MKLTIKITKEVLKESMYCKFPDTQNCGIAFAVREIFPEARVGVWTMSPIYGTPITVALPKIASDFVGRFDGLRRTPEKRLDLPEFSFEIDVPDSVIESIGIEEAKAIIEKSSTLELA